MGAYLINGQEFEIDESIQGAQLQQTLNQLAEQTRSSGLMQQPMQQPQPPMMQPQQQFAADEIDPFDEGDDWDDPLSVPVPTAPGRGVSKQTAMESAREIGANITEVFTGAKRMTAQIRELKEVNSAPELSTMSMASFKAAVGLMLTGKTNETKAILKKQFNEDVSFEEDAKGNVIVNFPSGQYALNKPGTSGQDLITGLVDMLAYSFVGKAAGYTGAVMKNALVEAVTETAEDWTGGEFSTEEVMASGLLGGGVKGVERAMRPVRKTPRELPGKDIVEAGLKQDVPVYTSDIRPPETFWGRLGQQMGEKMPVVGMAKKRVGQQKKRIAATERFTEEYKGIEYDEIVESLSKHTKKVKRDAGKVFDAVEKKLDPVGEIPLTHTNAAMRKAIAALSEEGVTPDPKALNTLRETARPINEFTQNFGKLKRNRTRFNDKLDAVDPAGRSQFGSDSKRILNQVQIAMSKDMTSLAKKELPAKEFVAWEKAKAIYEREGKKLKKTKLKNILDKGEATPEVAETMLFSRRPSEVNLLYDNLTPKGQGHARNTIISKITDDLALRGVKITPNAFYKEMTKRKLATNVFFRGERKEQLNGLLKVLEHTQQAQKAGEATPMGWQTLSLVTGGGIAGMFAPVPALKIAAAGLTIGLGARLYESAPVRNALIRLNALPRKSTQFEEALTEFFDVLNVYAQALRESSPEETP